MVVRFGRLGDTVLLQPLLHHLHRRYGLPCTLLARGTWPVPLYAGHADVARVIQLRDGHRPLALSPERWRAIVSLRRLRDAPVYVCEPEPRALLKIRRMLALAGIRRENCVFLSEMETREGEHWVDRLLRFGARTPDAFRDSRDHAGTEVVSAAPVLQVDDADRADCAAWLHASGLAGAPLVLLQPANKGTVRWNGVRGAEDDRWWPVDRWAQLARAIRTALPASRVLLCGAPHEAAWLHDIRKAAAEAGIEVVADALPLRRLMALLEIAHSMISVDTGPAHVAAALGCPLVVLFGSASPEQWRPRSATGSDVHEVGGPARGGRVDALDVDDVLAAWRTLHARSVPVYRQAGSVRVPAEAVPRI
ncbi:glycosyltransferase family 9 protein [Dokdonella soli]|uniref:Lipopolysaccharide heptosyltransferase family protein n=1 Tax=Dokdonella soli TaxID=529810 RepID=A0ABP3TJ27_9GAMM